MNTNIKNKLQTSLFGDCHQELVPPFKPSCLACIKKEDGKNYNILYQRSFRDDFNKLLNKAICCGTCSCKRRFEVLDTFFKGKKVLCFCFEMSVDKIKDFEPTPAFLSFMHLKQIEDYKLLWVSKHF